LLLVAVAVAFDVHAATVAVAVAVAFEVAVAVVFEVAVKFRGARRASDARSGARLNSLHSNRRRTFSRFSHRRHGALNGT
jgi:hypothetical protein